MKLSEAKSKEDVLKWYEEQYEVIQQSNTARELKEISLSQLGIIYGNAIRDMDIV